MKLVIFGILCHDILHDLLCWTDSDVLEYFRAKNIKIIVYFDDMYFAEKAIILYE